MTDNEAKSAFVRMRNRIEAIGALYRALSRTGAVDIVKAKDYLGAIVGAIVQDTVMAMEATPDALDHTISVDDISLSTQIAVPLGLITSELAANSLKYAYKGRDKGKLGLNVVTNKTGFEFTIWDDRPGIGETARVDWCA